MNNSIAIALACNLFFQMSTTMAQAIKANTSETNAFLKADKNKDLQLNAAEFRVFVHAMAENGQATAKKIRFFRAFAYAFSVADKNKDGLITPREMRSADNNYVKNN